MEPVLSYQIWLKLPEDVRHKLSMLFNIPKSGSTVVEYRHSGNVVTSDGYTPDDLRAISLAKLQAMFRTDDTNFYAMVEEAIDHIDEMVAGTYHEQKVLAKPVAPPIAKKTPKKKLAAKKPV